MTVETSAPVNAERKPAPFKRARNQYFKVQVKLLIRAISTGKFSFRKLWNVFLCDMAYLFKITKGSSAPYILSLEPWNECNAGCLFCRDKKGKIHDLNPLGGGVIKGKMPAEMAMDIIGQLKDDIMFAVLYTNGEPFLYQDLATVIKFATDNRVSTVIASNGLLMNEQNARGVLEAGLDLIKIQLSGFTQDIYSIQIRYGEVEKLKDNIRMLAQMNREGKYGTVILIDYILYNYNKHQLPLARQFCKELGVMMNVRPGNPFGGLENLEPSLVDKSILPLKISCDYLWKVMQVNFNGDILPCCEAVVWGGAKPYETFKMNQTNVLDVWRGKEAQAMRQGMKTNGRAGLPMCAQCTRKGVCFKW